MFNIGWLIISSNYFIIITCHLATRRACMSVIKLSTLQNLL